MALYVDTAALPEAKWALRLPFVAGLTCNPVLVAEALGKSEVTQQAYDAHLQQLAQEAPGGARIFVQVLKADRDGMVAEAQHIVTNLLGKGDRKVQATVKVPFTEEGVSAARALSSAKVSVAITGVFSVDQVYMAAATGAEYVIPYVSRLTPQEQGPLPVVRDMLEILRVRGFSTRLLAASVKSVSDLGQLLMLENCEVTVPPSVIRSSFGQPALKEAVSRFEEALRVQ